ncbi:MAG TPA: extracellular solute-binding protein [Candidatus Moranbacteria bacterium]|nr:extracellular solute-binding protein [Candidatus Moranbacteria bacterium]
MQYIIKNKFRIILAVLAVVAVPLFSGCGGSKANDNYKVNLEIWGPFDDSNIYGEIISQYKKLNTHIGEIKYRKFSQDTYKQELIDALASGQGPDIFLIKNTWFPSFENKIYPAPDVFVNQQDIKNNFPDVVSANFVSSNNDTTSVYAVPLSIDSMQLYYNRDMFNAAGIISPPKTWEEFQEDVKILTNVNEEGKIVRAGAAIGTAHNINQSTDFLSLLMLQNGVPLPMKKGEVAKFDEGVSSSNRMEYKQAGEAALSFYTQFAKASDSNGDSNLLYTWNSKQPKAVDAFAGGSVAMMANYAWQNSNIKGRNPKLNYDVTAIPQVDPNSPVTIADYWGYTVSLNKITPTASLGQAANVKPISNDTRAREAWQFLRFLTLKNSGVIRLYNVITGNTKDFPLDFDPAADYLQRTSQPAARRDLIEKQKTDPFLGVFALGNLFATSWYQKNPETVDVIFSSMIESINFGSSSLHDALVLARNRINGL